MARLRFGLGVAERDRGAIAFSSSSANARIEFVVDGEDAGDGVRVAL